MSEFLSIGADVFGVGTGVVLLAAYDRFWRQGIADVGQFAASRVFFLGQLVMVSEAPIANTTGLGLLFLSAYLFMPGFLGQKERIRESAQRQVADELAKLQRREREEWARLTKDLGYKRYSWREK